MFVRFDVTINDFIVQTGTHDMNIIPIFRGRESQCGAHHACSEDCDFLCHSH